jgi:hypothetical protein
LRRSGRLLDHGCVLLRDLIHLVDRYIHFLKAGRLLLRAQSNIGNDIVDVGDLRDDPLQGFAGFADEIDTMIDLRGRRSDKALDFLGGRGGTLRQGANFRRDDSKAPSRIASPRRLDARIQRNQRKKIRLKRDLIDDPDDLVVGQFEI